MKFILFLFGAALLFPAPAISQSSIEYSDRTVAQINAARAAIESGDRPAVCHHLKMAAIYLNGFYISSIQEFDPTMRAMSDRLDAARAYDRATYARDYLEAKILAITAGVQGRPDTVKAIVCVQGSGCTAARVHA